MAAEKPGCSCSACSLGSFKEDVVRRHLGCGLDGFLTVSARVTLEFTEGTTEFVTRCLWRILVSPAYVTLDHCYVSQSWSQ